MPFKPTSSDGGVADAPVRFRILSDSRDQPTSTQVDETQCKSCAPEDQAQASQPETPCLDIDDFANCFATLVVRDHEEAYLYMD